MGDDFRNRQDWFTPAFAMAVWAAHFSLVWAASSALPGDSGARILAGLLTVVAAGALWWLWRRAASPSVFTVAGLGLGIAALGTVYSAMPAIIG